MITAIVLAAGLSRRMGRFKLTLPWGEMTVLGQVLATLEAAGMRRIVTVTGHLADDAQNATKSSIVQFILNVQFAEGEMLSSIQVGLRALYPTPDLPDPHDPADLPPAALLCLGDQPQMEVATVQAVLAAGAEDGWARIVIPSYRRRAGHPILLPAWLWPEILACTSTLRDLLAGHRDVTRYLEIDAPSILADLDTPEDYKVG